MRVLLSFLFVAVLAVAPLQVRAADDLAAAKTYTDNVISKAMTIIKDTRAGKMNDTAAKTAFRSILNSAFDVGTISRFTLGRYWRMATPAEQTEFTRLVQKVILDKYADRVLSFAGDKYEIGNARELNAKDILVASTIFPADKPPVQFDWRLRRVNGGFKVIDLAVEGISMSVTHRTDFSSVIEANGGQVKALLDALQSKEKGGK